MAKAFILIVSTQVVDKFEAFYLLGILKMSNKMKFNRSFKLLLFKKMYKLPTS